MGKYNLILLDRDGVINKKVRKHNYVTSWQNFNFLPNSIEALALLTKKGYKIAVITNQKAVGKGLLSEKQLNAIHDKMTSEIEKAGGKISGIYCCPHLESCDCRKPSPFLPLKAMEDLNARKDETLMIGDFFSDYEMARNAGIDFVYIDSESDEREEQLEKFKNSGIKPPVFLSLYDFALSLK